jgi:hypothetical protein
VECISELVPQSCWISHKSSIEVVLFSTAGYENNNADQSLQKLAASPREASTFGQHLSRYQFRDQQPKSHFRIKNSKIFRTGPTSDGGNTFSDLEPEEHPRLMFHFLGHWLLTPAEEMPNNIPWWGYTDTNGKHKKKQENKKQREHA